MDNASLYAGIDEAGMDKAGMNTGVKGLDMRNRSWNGWRQRFASCSVALSLAVFGLRSALAVLSIAGSLLLALGTPQAMALGLGEIDTRSALNERFAAEIELLDTRDLDPSEVIASLASTDDFRRVGVERFFFLTSLQFEVVRNNRGNLVIKATSAQPITEPYLNFLVEVLWPSGRLLKEYTVLLDPPTFTHSAAAPVAAPSRESTDIASAGRVQRDQPASPAASAPSRSNSAPAAEGTGAQARTPAPRTRANVQDGSYGRTTRNDTMWAIANETLPSENVTPQQNMLAIQRLNPNAFIDGNVNLLKAGVVLRLPSESDAQAIDSATAEAQIVEQTRSWRAGTPAQAVTADVTADPAAPGQASQTDSASIDATSRGPGSADPAEKDSDGRLRIVAADASGVVDGTDNTGAGETQTTVAGDPAAQERIESLARQVDELTYQLDLQKRGVEEQISTREKQISLKDQQIAQLQAQLAAAKEAGSAQLQDQNTPTNTNPEATPIWQKPMVLGGVLGGLALLLAGVLFKRRQDRSVSELDIDAFSSSEPSFELAESASAEFATSLADADLVGDLSDADLALEQADLAHRDGDLAEDFGDATGSTNEELSDDDLFGPSDDAAPASASDDQTPQTSDVIGEADIYIAYGRYPQAIALLQGAVDSNPSDHAVRVRLLEVCAETKDAQSYAEQSRLLRQYCEDSGPLAAADALHASLESDFRAQVDDLAGAAESSERNVLPAAGGAAIVAGAAGLLDDETDSLIESFADDDDVEANADSEAEPFAFDTTVTDEADQEPEFEAVDFEIAEDDALDDASNTAGEFELDLDLGTDLESDLSDFDVPAVDTDEFATNVDMAPADLADSLTADFDDDSIPELSLEAEFDTDLDDSSDEGFDLDLDDVVDTGMAELADSSEDGTDQSIDYATDNEADTDDFDLDLGLDTEATGEAGDAMTAEDSGDALGGDLGLDFPDETTEMARVVAEADDDQLLDEIERSLDELEADGLLTPDLDEDAQFSFDDDADTSATKLDLARAYIDMGDDDGAREILGEVISEGDSEQQGEASELLDKL